MTTKKGRYHNQLTQKATSKQHDEILRAIKKYKLTTPEIAEAIGCQLATVYKKLNHAKQRGKATMCFYLDEYIALRDYIVREKLTDAQREMLYQRYNTRRGDDQCQTATSTQNDYSTPTQ